ncbi:hypothetical protein EVAR_26469_1 [Eumeta japonica]|uniref:Uncharacterized protein n=1 Tax=Eumeta variegata TaxID=151549 RepID=A0A4C1V8J4_EUMVA|nr:hypothetical protein EVAR_26469_1 [Eumeta japonica]
MDLSVNPNFVPVFSFGSGPGHDHDSNPDPMFGSDSVPVLNFGPDSRFRFPPRFRFWLSCKLGRLRLCRKPGQALGHTEPGFLGTLSLALWAH